MYQKYKTEQDLWWNNENDEPVPGNVVPIVGAGISIDPPTCLPDGITLTKSLIHHLVDERSATKILDTFKEYEPVLSRPVPRLEHLFSASAKVEKKSLKLLNIFDGVAPNHNHFAIARYLIEKRGWAITTNFDEAIEKAGNYAIPVHTFEPGNGSIEVAYGDKDTKWGLVKLHGSIGQKVEKLGATLEALAPGLPEPLRELLDHIFSNANFIVVAGYSASDHFDVNAFLRAKLNESYKAHLLWLNHTNNSDQHSDPRENIGFKTFQTGFNGVRVLDGNTHTHLSRLLDYEPREIPHSNLEEWETQLNDHYLPTNSEHHRIAAHLATTMGLSNLAQESIALLRYILNDDDEAILLEAKTYILEGRWWIAKSLLKHPSLKRDPNASSLQASLLRKAGHPIRSLMQRFFLWELRKRDKILYRLENACCLLDIYRSMMWMPFSQTTVLRDLWSWLISQQLNDIQQEISNTPEPSYEARYQLMRVREHAYCIDHSKFVSPMEFRNFIEDEVSYPELFSNGTPLIPGYYLSSATTAAELDDLPELLEVRLAFADALTVCARRSYLGKFRILAIAAIGLIYGEKRAQHKRRDEIQQPTEIMISSIKDQLEKASNIAEMLDCDHARSQVAEAWLRANRMMWGFHNWKRQRLYLP